MSEIARTQLEIRLVERLRRIAKDYQTPEQIRRSSEKDYGLSYSEALEYAYENLQSEAAYAIKGVRIVRPKASSGDQT